MKPLIVANWKMNPLTLWEAKQNFELIKEEGEKINNVETVICAPFVFLSALKPGANVKIGAQDCFWEEKGAYTGEVSPEQLADLGCEYVILGHSERRKYLGEQTAEVNQKIRAALMAGLNVIFCAGSETKEPGIEIKKQLEEGLRGIEKPDFSKIIITYEPVWSISTTEGKVVPTPREVSAGALYIRKVLEALFDEKIAQDVKIIYGGSVNSGNIGGFLKEGKMNGGLVGAASLDPKEFIDIIKAAC